MSFDVAQKEDHSRTIIHLDLDCFYAQVEMIKNPELRNVPLGIQQKNLLVTSNYKARELGVKKCMLISEALKICPNLTLINGEDLYDYRKFSTKVTNVVQKYTILVERLGLDENYADVTELVKKRKNESLQPVGLIYNSSNIENCLCGCFDRLNIGSVIAEEIRKSILEETGLTSCAGIAHNKLLAKLVGSVNKPNKQTILYPCNAAQLVFCLPDIKAIPGIGVSSFEILKTLGIKTVEDLRNCNFQRLEKIVGTEKANVLMDLSFGCDKTPVKISGKPQSIGIEDACKTISVENEIKEKFKILLHRLMVLLVDDGRIPRTIKVTVRKFDAIKKTSSKEQRQCNLSPSVFTIKNTIQLSQHGEEKIMSLIMTLFHKLVNIKKPFHVSLLGLAFTKFQARLQGKCSISSFLMKNLSVQSLTSLESNETTVPDSMDFTQIAQKSDVLNTGGSESEMEPSPKKTKLESFIMKHQILEPNLDCPSPSKLRVAELHLNSRDMDQSPVDDANNAPDNCPGNIEPEVFKELPIDIQNELLHDWNMQQKKEAICSKSKKSRPNTLMSYLIKH